MPTRWEARAAGGTIIDGGTLDINGQNLTNESVTVQGAGVGGNGAIINSGAQQTSALKDRHAQRRQCAPSGGTGSAGTSAALRPASAPAAMRITITKVGANQVSFVATQWTRPWAILTSIKASSASRPAPTEWATRTRLSQLLPAGTLDFYSTTTVMNKNCRAQRRHYLGRERQRHEKHFRRPHHCQ